jgi:hypothetical protein
VTGLPADDDGRRAGQHEQQGHRGGRGNAGGQGAGQHRAGDVAQVHHGGVERERGLGQAGARVRRPQAAQARAERRVDQAGRGRRGDQQPGWRPGEGVAQQGQQGEGVGSPADRSDRDQPAAVGQPAPGRARHRLAQGVARHRQPRHRHRRVLRHHQQDRDADHALRQPGEGVRDREPTQHRLGEQPAVRRHDGCRAHASP